MPGNQVIYHYTAAAGLQGIIESGAIWMTDARHLNDPGELVHAARIMRELVAAKIEGILPEVVGPAHEDAAASRISILRNVLSYFDRIEAGLEYEHSAYVAAFCEDGNLLSQWRGYGGGVLGYSLGFSRDLLEKSIVLGLTGDEGATEPVSLIAVDYGTDAVIAQIQAAVDRIATDPSGHPGVQAWSQFGQIVLPVLAKIKDPGFKEEKEWRLLLTTDGRPEVVEFRGGSTGLVPYVSARWPREALKEIIVGPGPDLELRADAVRQLLRSNPDIDESGVAVTTSSIPFRV